MRRGELRKSSSTEDSGDERPPTAFTGHDEGNGQPLPQPILTAARNLGPAFLDEHGNWQRPPSPYPMFDKNERMANIKARMNKKTQEQQHPLQITNGVLELTIQNNLSPRTLPGPSKPIPIIPMIHNIPKTGAHDYPVVLDLIRKNMKEFSKGYGETDMSSYATSTTTTTDSSAATSRGSTSGSIETIDSPEEEKQQPPPPPRPRRKSCWETLSASIETQIQSGNTAFRREVYYPNRAPAPAVVSNGVAGGVVQTGVAKKVQASDSDSFGSDDDGNARDCFSPYNNWH